MLFDPNWKPVIAPAEVPKIEPWREILKECAVIIQNRGWARGEFEAFAGQVCAIGAFRVVQGRDPCVKTGGNGRYQANDIKKAKQKLLATIPKEQNPTGGGSLSDKIMEWNDDHCRSKREMIKVFTAAAGE